MSDEVVHVGSDTIEIVEVPGRPTQVIEILGGRGPVGPPGAENTEAVAALAVRVTILEGQGSAIQAALNDLTAAAATDAELADAVAELEAALGADAATTAGNLAAAVATINAAMATDAELATAVASLVAAIALKQDAATAATDAELAAQIAIVTAALSDLEGVVATDAELAAAFDALSASMATDAEVAALLAPIVASLTAHVADGALDGGPHGLPALTADGMAWVRIAGALAATNIATQGELDAEALERATTVADVQATAAAALPKAGGTMTGPIVLAGDPVASLNPATRQWVLARIADLVNGAPGALDTLRELADQLASDEGAVIALTATVAGKLAAAANLGDLVDAIQARANLGLGSAATHAAGDFDASGAAAGAELASQPRNANLTAIAGLVTTAYGRGVLALADAAALLAYAGAVTTARTITAGAGLTGGGDLSANRALAVDFGTGAGKVVQGNDAALTDTRTPTDGSVTAAKVAGSLKPSGTAVDATEALRALGTSAGQAAPGTSIAGLVTLAPATSARNVVQPSGDVVALVVKGSAGQTADVWQSQTSAGVVNASVSASGALGVSKATVTGAADVVQFAVIGNASQSARVMQVLSSGAVEWFAIGNNGRIVSIGANITPTSTSVNAIVATSAASASVATVLVKAGASQTGNLLELQNSASAVVASVSSVGALTLSGAGSTNAAPRELLMSFDSSAAVESMGIRFGTDATYRSGIKSAGRDLVLWNANRAITTYPGSSEPLSADGQGFRVIGNTASWIQCAIQGGSGQTANLQNWQNSAGTPMASIASDGGLYFGNDVTTKLKASGGATIVGASLSIFAVQGAGSQVAVMDNGGSVAWGSARSTTATYRGTANGGGVTLVADTATGIPLVIKGAASQSAALQTWTSSANTVVASVTATGLLKWSAAGNEQLTVGAAGAAAAIPATPTKFLKVVDSAGTTLVIPAYAAA